MGCTVTQPMRKQGRKCTCNTVALATVRTAGEAGDVSAFLKVKVPDLTLLKKNNKGIYPLDQVILAIDGRRKLRSHGDPKMPVWGESFIRETKDPKTAEVTVGLKEKAIAEYVATLQR